ncbi:MAG: hypothetical protein R3244_03640 [Thermoanaerobaculia bacterium]|nr:hypothetical protein [Thermoanaerobaculia bacterium]
MSSSLIEKLFAAGGSVTGKAFRVMAGLRSRDSAVQPLETNNYGSLNVGFGDFTGTKDVFSRLRVTEPFGLFDAKQLFDKQPLVYVEDVQNGGSSTHLPNESSTRMDVTTTTNSRVIRQSRAYIPYQPGRSQYAILTGVIGAAVANLRRRMGYFDANNGVYLEQNGTTDVAFTLRSFVTGVVDNSKRITQANWNIDPLDGSGPSGKTLDLTKFIVMFTEFGWLGGAGVKVGLFIEGQPIYVHEFDLEANTTVFLSTPSLPVRWEIENLAAASGSMKHTCAVVFSEGGFDPQGAVTSEPTTSAITVGTTETALIAVRLRSAYARGTLIPLSASGQVTSIDEVIFRVRIRSTITGGTWVTSDTGQSEFQLNPAFSGGIKIATFFANDNGGSIDAPMLENALRVAANFAGTADTLVLTAQNDSATANVLGQLTWKEVL